MFELMAIAVGLALDAFAVALAAGAAGSLPSLRAKLRLAFHFGIFQALMPILGWFLGSTVAGFLEAIDHWIAFGLLAIIGTRMIRSGLSRRAEELPADPSRGMTLVGLSVATSIDALAVGFSLAMLRIDVWMPSAVIGLVTAALAMVGIQLGGRLGRQFSRGAEALGGTVLILIGSRIVISHIFA